VTQDALIVGAFEARYERHAPAERDTKALLKEAGLIRTTRKAVKILGKGELTTSLTVVAHAVSASAREKIEAAGGSVSLLREPKVKKKTKSKAKAKPAATEQAEQTEKTEETDS